MLVLENRVVSYTPPCVKYVISSFVPYPSDFKGGLRFLGLENEDPGQTFG